jgi:homoserine acetyltransferase
MRLASSGFIGIFWQAVIPLVPQAHANRQVNFIWEAARQVITLDPKWRDGAYPAEDPPRRGTGLGMIIQNAFGISAAGYEEAFRDGPAVHRGYAALAGVTLTPDRFACAVSVAGVSDLPEMLAAERREERSHRKKYRCAINYENKCTQTCCCN